MLCISCIVTCCCHWVIVVVLRDCDSVDSDEEISCSFGVLVVPNDSVKPEDAIECVDEGVVDEIET